jgi:hypothetical protein
MDSSVSSKDEIWFLRVCHRISNAVYQRFGVDMPSRNVGSQLPTYALQHLTSTTPRRESENWHESYTALIRRYVLVLEIQSVYCELGNEFIYLFIYIYIYIYIHYIRELRAAHGRAMTQAVNRRPLAAENRVRSQVSSCEICGVQCGPETGYSQSFPPLVSFHHYATPYSSSSTRFSVLTVSFQTRRP